MEHIVYNFGIALNAINRASLGHTNLLILCVLFKYYLLLIEDFEPAFGVVPQGEAKRTVYCASRPLGGLA